MIQGLGAFTPRRFHSATTVGSDIFVFGGCHADYIYVNDMFVFHLEDFIKSGQPVVCNSVPMAQNSPSKRWGHSSVAYEDSIIIFGGRNEHDLNDLY